MNTKKSVYETLSIIDMRGKTKSVQRNEYLPWAQAWGALCKVYPTATYEFHEDENGFPYRNTPLGLFVKVSVTVEGITHTMHRPVYSNANKSMKIEPYEYNTKSGKKIVEGAVASDINDALMRTWAKCIAIHGLSINLFKGEQYADLELIDSSQISEMSDLISKHKLMLGDLNAHFGINRLSELAAFNYEAALKWVENAIIPKKD